MNKDLLSLHELSRTDIELILEQSAAIKEKHKSGVHHRPLEGKCLGMIFAKSSTRTRVSFEVGMHQLGGHALFLNARDIQLGRGETIADTASVLSRYLDAIVIRTFKQSDVEDLGAAASIPVINGLTDLEHPCQTLADLFTVKERIGSFDGLRIAYVGDGNNMANSWLCGAAKLGINLSVACPSGYEPDAAIAQSAIEEGRSNGCEIRITHNPIEAVKNAHVICTDVWTSMGQEEEHQERLKAFRDYQINLDLARHADPDFLFMHCLPAHRGEEVTAEIIDGPHSIVLDEAENRLHAQKAILELLMGGDGK